MDAAFVFGNLGNIVSGLGRGWSIEDAFAWAIGDESVLTLPLPDETRQYTFHCDIHPAIYPPKVAHQRLTVIANDQVIGSFVLTGRTILAIPLPPDLARGQSNIQLRLLHPDAARPCDHMAVQDSRLLALCFHSATLAATASGQAAGPRDPASLEPVHGLLAGGATAMRIKEIIGKLPALRGRLGVRFIDLSAPLTQATEALPPGTLETADFCWIEDNAGTPATRDPLRAMLPAGCTVRTFLKPTCQSLWPFLSRDPRAVPEPGRYHPARYPFGDRLAQALAGMNMPDDVVYLMYEMSAEQEQIDLTAALRADARRWRNEDAAADLKLADFIQQNFATTRMFVSPNRVGPALMQEIVRQILDDGLVRDVAGNLDLDAQLDALLDGYAGWQEELPVHKRVAAHFGLAWWSPDMTYYWMNNARTYRSHTLDYIRWVQWRP